MTIGKFTECFKKLRGKKNKSIYVSPGLAADFAIA